MRVYQFRHPSKIELSHLNLLTAKPEVVYISGLDMQKKKSYPGFFLVFEGGEGCGKSTQLRQLARTLSREGIPIVLTREPGGTPLGKGIRQLLLHAKHKVSPEAELFLYEADRAHHVASVVKPALSCGQVVLSDRHADSTAVYQGMARGMHHAETLNSLATSGLTPDLVIILDVPPEIGLARVRGRGAPDRLEREKMAFHKKVRKGFLALAKKNSRRYRVFNGTGDPKEIGQEIQRLVKTRLERKGLWPQH
ncbi:MAG: dTMP kinase [Bdellovibrionales bacterium]|nr:dTMP kinase [Bdellovibrionales bacterium]